MWKAFQLKHLVCLVGAVIKSIVRSLTVWEFIDEAFVQRWHLLSTHVWLRRVLGSLREQDSSFCFKCLERYVCLLLISLNLGLAPMF